MQVGGIGNRDASREYSVVFGLICAGFGHGCAAQRDRNRPETRTRQANPYQTHTKPIPNETKGSFAVLPYKGGSAAMTDVVGQRLDITMQPISESLPFIHNGGLRALGQTGSVRSPIAPDIPTLAEAGVKGYSVTTWYMLLAPAKLPEDIVVTLAGKFDQALRQPDLREKLQRVGVSVINGGPKQAGSFLKSEADKWAQAIKVSGTRIE